MSERAQEALLHAYAGAFHDYLTDPREAALARAYELGRSALIAHLGVLDLAIIHSRVVASALESSHEAAERMRFLDASERFFVEALVPFEMAHRGFREANGVLRRLNETLEAQAKRIASALHEGASQLLASLHLGLADAARTAPADTAKQLHAVRGLLDQMEERLRTLSHELRPPILDDLGLVPALEFLCDSVSKRWGFPVSVQASIGGGLVPATVETTVYRITQEALTNVSKHARATRADVLLVRTDRVIRCSILDDGIGLGAPAANSTPQGLGLREIKERVSALGGMLHLGSNDGGGANATVEIPLET